MVVLNDNDHTYEYVIEMLKALFGHPVEKGYQLAKLVDSTGKAIVCTTSLERAELKRDQIHAYGPEPRIPRCQGAMQARIEKLHRSWTKDREYLPPPALGKLAELDPALIVTPPKGLEVGYVPIVTRQGARE